MIIADETAVIQTEIIISINPSLAHKHRT